MILVQSLDQIKNNPRSPAVEIARRLISQKNFRPGNKGACQRYPLLLAAGKLPGAVLCPVTQLNLFQPFRGFEQRSGFSFTAGQQRHGYILGSCKLWQ